MFVFMFVYAFGCTFGCTFEFFLSGFCMVVCKCLDVKLFKENNSNLHTGSMPSLCQVKWRRSARIFSFRKDIAPENCILFCLLVHCSLVVGPYHTLIKYFFHFAGGNHGYRNRPQKVTQLRILVGSLMHRRITVPW